MYCDLLMGKLSTIAVSKTPPPDVTECLATLIYAAPRVDVQELTVIREMLVSKFGKDICRHLVENSVNQKVQFKLSIETPDQATVYEYMSEIANTAGLKLNMDPPVRPQASQAAPTNAASLKAMFPEPPTSTITPSAAVLALPSVPSFPSPPSSNVSSVPDVPIPTFNPSQLPGVPSPNFGSSTPSFPSPPSSNPAPSFPSTPNSAPSKSDDLVFPSPPSSGDNKPPASGGSNDVPDFDDLVERFQKLKKK